MTQLLHFQLPLGGSFSIPAKWWDAAGMNSFCLAASAYSTATKDARPVQLNEIVPLSMEGRQHRDYGGFDRVRMTDVLSGIAASSDLPAIEVVPWPKQPPFAFRLCDGAHRFYASVAAGFSHVPTVKGWIPETEYL